jgi:hypothetical protein
MSTLLIENEVSNVATEFVDVTVSPVVETEDVSPNQVEGATDDEQAKIDAYKASEAKVVELATATLDPKDMLKKYAKLGAEALKLAHKRKASLKAGSWNGKDDLNKVCSDLETLVKMRVAVRDVKMLVYIRVHLWVEAVKPINQNVDKLSFHVVVNKYLPTLQFDPVELTGEIKNEWLTFVRTSVETQLGDAPLTMSEVDSAIKEYKAELEAAKRKTTSDEKQLERERKAEESKVRKDRRDAQTLIADSLDKAIVDGHAETQDVVEIVNKVLADHKMELPAKLAGFDPATCTAADCKVLVSAMANAGKVAEMKALHSQLDAMLKIIANSLTAANAA